MSDMLKGRLLVVEDEPHLGFSLRFNFEAEGYAVTLAETLVAARAELEEAAFDLIILDMMLPDGHGIDLCRNLRAASDHTPILFLTAMGDPEDIVGGLKAGGDDYLTKPFVLAELLTRVAAILRRQRWNDEALEAEVPDVFSFGESHHIDFSTRQTVAMGRAVSLTDLELRLLRLFIARQDQVVSRQDMLEQVWGMSRSTNTRTVDNFMVRLRRLFEDDPSRPKHFLTVRGVGYRFVP